jgi:hypothetical protein
MDMVRMKWADDVGARRGLIRGLVMYGGVRGLARAGRAVLSIYRRLRSIEERFDGE